MIDEWFEARIDWLCETLPKAVKPWKTRFCSSRFGWHLYLLTDLFNRWMIAPLMRIPLMEKAEEEQKDAPKEEQALPEDGDVSFFKWLRRKGQAFSAWFRSLGGRIKRWFLQTIAAIRDWFDSLGGRLRQGVINILRGIWLPIQLFVGWLVNTDERWLKSVRKADERDAKWMRRAMPAMAPVRRSRFPLVLLLTMLSVLGVCATGSAEMAYSAASACALWLSLAFEIGYQPVCGRVRQRYLASMMLRALSFAVLIPLYFGAYVRQGVQNNIVLQTAMTVMLVAHGAFFLLIVAFRRTQPMLLRAMSGVLGVIPALAVAASVTLAVSYAFKPLETIVSGVLGALGVLFLFCGDRMTTLHDLGGIRLRFEPFWNTLFTVGGLLMVVLGAWIGAV